MSQPRKPIYKRPLDLVYVLYFLQHIPASAIADSYALLPRKLLHPTHIKLVEEYVTSSRDPIMANIARPTYAWARAILTCEACIQIPIFMLAIVGLVRNDRRIWPLLLAYGAHSATGTLVCLAELFNANLPTEYFRMNLAVYSFYLVFALLIMFDMYKRIVNTVVKYGQILHKYEGKGKGKRE